MISGWLAENELETTETIAQNCYGVLFPSENWQEGLCAQGDFLNGKLYEIWQHESFPNHHVVILLFPNRDMAIKGAEYYPDWMGLFSYWHKITWAYHQSRKIKAELRSKYQKVEKNAKIIKRNEYGQSNLTNIEEELKNIQESLDQYTTDLSSLTFQKEIIEINLVNLQRRIELIKKKSHAKNNLDSLDKFADLVNEKYLLQINKDLENMQLAFKLLENKINAMNSKIELEKEKRERNFQTLVTFIGTGMAGAKLFNLDKIACGEFLGDSNWICKNAVTEGIVVPIVLILIFGTLGAISRSVIKGSFVRMIKYKIKNLISG
ncbi:MAG: hypothetical protein AAGA80_22940 [Cyanobacteria bacterium P01_F01_bin.143]